MESVEINTILVIGFGNQLRGDDGAGRLAACHLTAVLADCPGVRVCDCHQLVPELAEEIARAGAVVFVDASAVDPPGEVVCREVEPQGRPEAGPHDLTPAGILGWALALYGRCPPAWIYSVGAASFALSDELSEVVAAALGRLEAAVAGHVRGGVEERVKT
jgi:hydrogenase maturation protease